MSFIETLKDEKGFWGAVGGFLAIVLVVVKYLLPRRDEDKPLSDSHLAKNIKFSVQVEDKLVGLQSKYQDIAVCSIGAVTNSDMPVNLQIVYSSDHKTYRVWADKEPMELELRRSHMEMMLKGDDKFMSSQLENPKSVDWLESMGIKQVYVFSVGLGDFYIDGELRLAHMVLYVNFKTSSILSGSVLNDCRICAKEIKEIMESETSQVLNNKFTK